MTNIPRKKLGNETIYNSIKNSQSSSNQGRERLAQRRCYDTKERSERG